MTNRINGPIALRSLIFVIWVLFAWRIAPVEAAAEPQTAASPCVENQPDEEKITSCTKLLLLPDLDVATRVNALIVRGSAYAVHSQAGFAIKDFEEAQKFKYNPNVAFTLSTLYINTGRDEDAITELLKIVDAGSANAIIFNSLGAAYQNAGNYDASIDSFNKALFLNPKYIVALNNRAAAYEKKGDYDQAGKDIDAVLAINPNLPIALVNRCQQFARAGKLDQGLPFCMKAEHLDPDDALILVSIAGTYYHSARFEDALKYLDRSISLVSDNPRFLYMRGMTKAKLGRKEEADADISKATSIMPNVAADMAKVGVK